MARLTEQWRAPAPLVQLFASARRIAPESGAEATKLKGDAEQFQETVLGEYRAQLESDSMNENCESASHNEEIGTRTAVVRIQRRTVHVGGAIMRK